MVVRKGRGLISLVMTTMCLCSIFILNTLCKLEMISNKLSLGFPGGSDGKESECNA